MRIGPAVGRAFPDREYGPRLRDWRLGELMMVASTTTDSPNILLVRAGTGEV